MKLRWASRAVVVALAWAGVGMVVASPARADDVPFLVTPISSEAGYFQVQGTCPPKTKFFTYRWTPASNGRGWANMAGKPAAFSIRLRLLAGEPGQTISVTLDCVDPENQTLLRLGPVDVVSGVDLLPLPADSGSGKRIVYSVSAQQLWAVEADGAVARTYLVSGRRMALAGGVSHQGKFRVYEKRRRGCGGGCPNWLTFRQGRAGTIAFHEIPENRAGRYQTDGELGQPRSHGCVRQSKEDAAWLMSWVKLRDVVMVVA